MGVRHFAAGASSRRYIQNDLDAAVRAGYRMKAKNDVLAFLLALNHVFAEREAAGEP